MSYERMVQCALVCLAAFAGCGAGDAGAQEARLPEPPGRRDSDVISGLLVNQTVSALGLVFFRQFADAWRDRPDADSYTLTIVEKPSRRLGNQILILNGQTRVLVLSLPIRYDRVAPTAEQAVEAVYGNLLSQVIPLLGKDPDLGSDEM